MLDINHLRNNFDVVSERIKSRNKDYPALKQFKVIDQN
jgi:seryl-tRNA synthetase